MNTKAQGAVPTDPLRHEGVSDKIAGADVPQADLLGLVEPVWADEDAEAVHTDV
jgi:hypothetical protein